MQQYSSESQRLSTQFLPAGTVASSEARLMTRFLSRTDCWTVLTRKRKPA